MEMSIFQCVPCWLLTVSINHFAQDDAEQVVLLHPLDDLDELADPPGHGGELHHQVPLLHLLPLQLLHLFHHRIILLFM